MNEYATDILASSKNIHIVLTEDFSFGMCLSLNESHVNPDAEFDELLLESRESRSRLSYIFRMKSLAKYEYYK